MENTRIILGIGNPGKKYAETYHNAGLLFAEALKKSLMPEEKFQSLKGKHFDFARRDGIVIARSKTFMNESGASASEATAYFEAPPANLFVAHDESDLPLGYYKIESGRGAAGHHGVESIAASLGTTGFWRVRIGTRPGKPEGAPREKAGDFALRRIAKSDAAKLAEVFGEISAKLIGIISGRTPERPN